MEPIPCVVDANTLIEHIHEIKSWTYDGHLNLVLPLCTIERVEQLCKTKKEQQETKTLDSPKKRLSWKNARKEHPAFDINLQVASEFIKRMEIEGPSASVVFQRISEEYSPWKGVEVPQEKSEIKEDRPSTFAQALARSSPVNGLPEIANVSKGPLKPKLVAKASGVDLSPWKMNKKAPRVPPSEVPEAIRPLLSYTLWRLYENVATWSESNPTILLSSDAKMSTMARKLNITVKQMGQLRQAITERQANKPDRNIIGDLEQCFGLPKPKLSLTENGGNHLHLENLASQTEQYSEPYKLAVSDEFLNGDSSSSEKTEIVLTAARDDKTEIQVSKDKLNDEIEVIQNDHPDLNLDGQESTHHAMQQTIIAAKSNLSEEPKSTSDEPESITSKEMEPTASEKPSQLTSDFDSAPEKTITDAPKIIFDRSTTKMANVSDTILLAKIETSGDRDEFVSNSVRSSPEKQSDFSQESHSEPSQLESFSRSATANGSLASSRRSSHEFSPLQTQTIQEPEDSDEEVVVFNPRAKRFSSQQKPPQQATSSVSDSTKTASITVPLATNATASTTVSAKPSGIPPATSSMKASIIAPSVGSTVANLHKPAFANSNPPKQSSGRGNSFRPASAKANTAKSNAGRNSRPPAPLAPAAIIDPDFFGRTSVVNIRPNIQNGYPRHSPRGSPRRGSRVPESDVDYVLSSGTTREAARGKGKLWIP